MEKLSREERLMTELEIRNLLVRERYYRDAAQWVKLRNCYHPDTEKTNIKITWFNGNIEGFVAGSKMLAQRSVSSHTISPIEIHLNGDKAVSESAGSILARFEYDGVDYDCTNYGRFISRLERVDMEWKMLTLEVIYEKDAIQPVKPSGPPKTLALDSEARKSYRCLAWVFAQGGIEVDQNLPGIDIPESVESLMESCFTWLNGTPE